MRLEIASSKAIKHACLNYHYSRSVPFCAFSLSVFNDQNEWCGVVLYSLGANQHLSKMFGYMNGEVAELTRVALNGKIQPVSKVIAISLKLLQKKNPLIKAVISYADMDQDHVGTIYQASNWTYIGDVETYKPTPKYLIHGVVKHGRTISANGWKQNIEWLRKHIDPKTELVFTKGKRKYAIGFTPEAKKLLSSLSKPYPKKTIPAIEA